jgi:hypothetical protein
VRSLIEFVVRRQLAQKQEKLVGLDLLTYTRLADV